MSQSFLNHLYIYASFTHSCCERVTKDVATEVWKQGGVVHKEDNTHFRISVDVAVSPQFYGWVFGLGKMVRIVAPEDVRQGYLDMMKDVQEKYE